MGGVDQPLGMKGDRDRFWSRGADPWPTYW